MEEDFIALLRSSASVLALVPAASISMGDAAQGTVRPSIVCRVISDAVDYTHSGPDRLQSGRVQVDCVALSYAAAKAISRAVILTLGGYRGGAFSGIFHESTRDSREGGSNEAERPYLVSLDFMTHWRS
jgi:hypothetical protein